MFRPSVPRRRAVRPLSWALCGAGLGAGLMGSAFSPGVWWSVMCSYYLSKKLSHFYFKTDIWGTEATGSGLEAGAGPLPSPGLKFPLSQGCSPGLRAQEEGLRGGPCIRARKALGWARPEDPRLPVTKGSTAHLTLQFCGCDKNPTPRGPREQNVSTQSPGSAGSSSRCGWIQTRPAPGHRAQLVRAPSRYASVSGLMPSQGTYKNPPMTHLHHGIYAAV